MSLRHCINFLFTLCLAVVESNQFIRHSRRKACKFVCEISKQQSFLLEQLIAKNQVFSHTFEMAMLCILKLKIKANRKQKCNRSEKAEG